MHKRDINEYLYYEFSYDISEDAEASQISEDWPFRLSLVGSLSAPEGDTEVFLFADDEEEYFALAGPSLAYCPRAGMDLAHLRLQSFGSSWIASQDPVDLDTVILADDSAPPSEERRQRVEDIARQYLGDTPYSIREGLFLRRTGKYVALIQPTNSDNAMIVGTNIVVRNIPFPSASAWRRLAVGIGNLVEGGKLG